MSALTKNWLHVVPWEAVVSINAALCEARKALHKPTSDGYEPAKKLWEQNRLKKISLPELLQLCFQCHRLAPFCNYNGNTFVTIVKTLLDAELKRLPPGGSRAAGNRKVSNYRQHGCRRARPRTTRNGGLPKARCD